MCSPAVLTWALNSEPGLLLTLSSESKLKWLGIAAAGLTAAAVAGCATHDHTKKASNHDVLTPQTRSTLGIEKTEYRTPFWRRYTHRPPSQQAPAEKSAQNGAQQASSNQSQPERVAENAPQQGASRGSAAQTGAAAPPGSGLRSKIGVTFEGRSQKPDLDRLLLNALQRQAGEDGLIVVPPEALAKAVRGSKHCSSGKPSACPAQLAIYPGIRMLLVIQPQSASGDTVQLRTRMVGTDFDADHAPQTAQLNLSQTDSESGQSDLAAWSRHTLERAAKRLGNAPWFAHSFSSHGGDYYINSGRLAGLDTGAVLLVHKQGSAVHAPNGDVVAWNPGSVAGKLKVEQFLGQHIAVAKSVSGQKPRPEDKLTVGQ